MEKLERKIMTVILVIVVILALFLGLIGFISDFMWFKEMGYTAVFFKQLVTQLNEILIGVIRSEERRVG